MGLCTQLTASFVILPAILRHKRRILAGLIVRATAAPAPQAREVAPAFLAHLPDLKARRKVLGKSRGKEYVGRDEPFRRYLSLVRSTHSLTGHPSPKIK